MKTMDNCNDWLGSSLSPNMNVEVPSEISHHQGAVDNCSFFPSPSHLISSCYGVEGDSNNGEGLYSLLPAMLPLSSDGSLCIVEALTRLHQQEMVPTPSPKQEDFLGDGGANIGGHHQYGNNHRETMDLQHQPCFQPLDMYNPPFGIGYGNLHSLSLSMSPGSQSSSATAPPQQIPTMDLVMVAAKKRGSGKGGQKQQPVSRKCIDTFGQRTSQYRGVTRHRWTGRYEAHLWDNTCKKEGQTRKGRQVYLGGYDMEEKAARAYDLAALKYWGPATRINFPLENYQEELEEMKSMGRQEYVANLRRKSSGFSRGASMYRGVTRHHQHGRWQARIGRVAGNKDVYLGTFSTQEEAAEAYDVAALKFRGVNAVTNFEITRYDVKKIMESSTLLSGELARKKKKKRAIEGGNGVVVSCLITSKDLDLTAENSSNRTPASSEAIGLAANAHLSVDPSSFPTSAGPIIGSWIPSSQLMQTVSAASMPLFAAWSDA